MTKHFFINEGCHSSMKKQQINCFIKAYVSTWNIIIFKTLLSTRHYVQTRNRCENLDLAGRNVIFGIIVNTFKFSTRNTLVYLSSRHLALVCKPVLCFFVFFLVIGIHSIQGWTATTRHGVTRKKSTKRLQHTGNLFRKNLQLEDVDIDILVTSRNGD